jgi:acetylornithine deacetylase
MTNAALDPTELLQRLVAIDSTSSRTNLPVINLVEKELLALGFTCVRQPWADERGVQKENLIAQRGDATAQPGLAFVGHSDCVPFDPAWAGALKAKIEEGKLYARGSADTKGYIAAAISAASRITNHKQPLMVLITADEEVGCLGAKKLLEEFEEKGGRPRPRRAIIGEPTRMVPIRGHKGYCLAEISITGGEGHSAYPDTGASAILAAGRILRELEELGVRLKGDPDPLFNPPYTTLNVGLISGGTAKNVIAGACKLTLEWRPVPGQDVKKVLGEVEAACARHTAGMIRCEVRPSRLDLGVATEPGELIQFLEGKTGNRVETIPFGTELPYLAALGAEACVFGPGDIRVAHRTGEFIPLNELNAATEILSEAIARFCN